MSSQVEAPEQAGAEGSPRSSYAGRVSIECNNRPFRVWLIDVTDYDLK
jgi:hypothetical protein